MHFIAKCLKAIPEIINLVHIFKDFLETIKKSDYFHEEPSWKPGLINKHHLTCFLEIHVSEKVYSPLCRWRQLPWTATWGTTRCAPLWTGITHPRPPHQTEAGFAETGTGLEWAETGLSLVCHVAVQLTGAKYSTKARNTTTIFTLGPCG